MMPPGGFQRTDRRLIHLSAWKEYSQKSLCRTVHRAPVLRRIRPLLTLKAQNSNYYIWRTGVKMRSGQYTVTPQDADTRGGVAGVRTPVCYQRPGRLRLMRVEVVLKARRNLLGPTSAEEVILGYKTRSRRL
jgi:hypothetical protein